MRLLGAILAGGQSRRFGSDKAQARLDGATLIDRVSAALAPQVASLVICGRSPGLADRPGGVGPLGGLAAALHHGAAQGYDAVVSVPCDTPLLPGDLATRLGAHDGATYLSQSPVIGLWPCALATSLDAYLAATDDYSMRGWAVACGAEARTLDTVIPNINTPADLAKLIHP